jgi:acetyl-CoA carboxylase carboxyl transferase beta subunit
MTVMTPMARLRATEFLDVLVDPGSWRSWDEPIAEPPDADTEYAADLARARTRNGVDEAVITGEGRIHGHRVAIVASEFGFLAGSIGVMAGERLCRAVERATAERLPLVASPASGGTRMQEGTVAFVQMIKVVGAITDHTSRGLPYLVYLRHPSTGGAFASWGSLGQLTFAEPGALIAFLGPRVYEALHGASFPPGVQVAENLYAHGLVDAVVPPDRLAEVVGGALTVMCAPRTAPRPVGAPPDQSVTDTSAAESIRRTRRPERPGVHALLAVAARDVTPLNGTGAGETDPAVLLALARFGNAPCVIVGQDRAAQQSQPLGPAALRTARRGMRLAAQLRLPLITVIDTGGAALSPQAEEAGLASEIAHCTAELLTLPTPTLSILLGQGAGGAALALLPTDRVVAAQHAWLSPLPPEGASAILYRSTRRAAEIAERQGVGAARLLSERIVDRVVDERPDAAEQPEAFLHRLAAIVEADLADLTAHLPATRMAARRRRYRQLGLREDVPGTGANAPLTPAITRSQPEERYES